MVARIGRPVPRHRRIFELQPWDLGQVKPLMIADAVIAPPIRLNHDSLVTSVKDPSDIFTLPLVVIATGQAQLAGQPVPSLPREARSTTEAKVPLHPLPCQST